MPSLPIPLFIAMTLSVITLFNLPGSVITQEEGLNEITGLVMQCHDGDTLSIKCLEDKYEADKHGLLHIRLYLGDSPEYDERRPWFQQPMGLQAKKALSSMCLNREVRVVVHGLSYKRLVGSVWCNGVLVNHEMIRLGLAHVDQRYGSKKERAEVLAIQDEAIKARRGVWGQNKIEMPWDFRERMKKHGSAA